MKPFLLMAFLLSAAGYTYAGDPPSAIRTALAALEHAHNTHGTAMKSCGFETEHEIGWDYMEREMRELANTQTTPTASRMVELLPSLRIERRSLLRDFVRCSFKLGQTKTAESIIDAMNSLDEAAGDIEDSIRDRAWNLEKGAEWYTDHPCPSKAGVP